MSFNYNNRVPMSKREASDALRLRWFAWQGRNNLTTSDALRMLGLCSSDPKVKHRHKWTGQGNIPDDVFIMIQKQIGEAA